MPEIMQRALKIVRRGGQKILQKYLCLALVCLSRCLWEEGEKLMIRRFLFDSLMTLSYCLLVVMTLVSMVLFI